MIVDRKMAMKVFDEYVKNYNANDEKIKLKIEHTYRVCELCESIAQKSGFSKEEMDLAWVLGLLHDIGRFEQLRRYGTFIDADSIDHAEFGADILFKQGKIREFVSDIQEDKLIENAVRYHSSYRLPEFLTERERKFADLLRDADKIDILKVNIIVPLEEIYNVSTYELTHSKVSEEVFKAFWEEHAVLRKLKKTPVDHVVGHISLVYELVYPVSMKLVDEQGYLNKLMNFQSEIEETQKQFELIREKIKDYMGRLGLKNEC